MDAQPLDTRDAWTLTYPATAMQPRTWGHPSWQGKRPARYEPLEPGRRHLTAWVGGEGTALEPWVVEVSTEGRWPNLAELRGALMALTHAGAFFEFAFPCLAALPFTEIPPVLMLQVSAVPGSPAESRLKLSGGIVLTPSNGKPTP